VVHNWRYAALSASAARHFSSCGTQKNSLTSALTAGGGQVWFDG